MRVVRVRETIAAPLDQVYAWFYESENFKQSPIVFKSSWRGNKKREVGAVRDIVMLAGWYQEEMTEIVQNQVISYRVNQSFPKVIQDFTQLTFEEREEGVLVEWVIELETSPAFLTGLGGRMAAILYGSIMKTAKRALEGKNYEIK